MPDKILPTRAGKVPDRPNQYYVPDPYTGGLKLDRNAVRGDMEFDRFEKRQKEYVSFVDAQNAQFDATLAVIKARIDELSFGPERQQMVELYNRYVEERRAWGEDLVAMGDEIYHLEKDEKGNLKRNSAGMYIEHRGDVGNDALAPVWDVSPDKRHIFAAQYYKADRAAKEMPAMHARLVQEWEQLNVQFKEGTKKRYVDAVVQYRIYQGLKDVPGVKPKELRAAASNAVKALDALGSHLYTERAGMVSPPELRAQFVDAANKEFSRRGIAVDEAFMASVSGITPDRDGVPALLALRREIFADASLANPGDIPLRKALINAIERERAYLVERGGMQPEKIGDLARQGVSLENSLLADLAGKTNELIKINAESSLILAAAQKEYYELQAYDTPEANARKKELFNRETPFGIVQQQYAKMHETLKADTDASVKAEPAGIDGMRLILDDIRAEGSFLHKHVAQMTPEFQERLQRLRTMQDTAVVNMVNKAVDLTRALQPVGAAKEIEAVLPDLFRWEASALDPKLPQNARAAIAARVRLMREDVNASILMAKDTKPLDLARVDIAVKNIVAEGRLLRALGLDEPRVQSINAELSILKDLSKQVDDAVTAETQPKNGLPTLASFRKADQLLQSEAKMIREAFKHMPQAQIDRLKSIDARRASLIATLSTTTKAAVDALDLKTDTRQQIENARELLDREFALKGGPGMADVKELERLMAMYEKIWKAQQALSVRPDPAEDSLPSVAPVIAPEASKPSTSPAANVEPTVEKPETPDVAPEANKPQSEAEKKLQQRISALTGRESKDQPQQTRMFVEWLNSDFVDAAFSSEPTLIGTRVTDAHLISAPEQGFEIIDHRLVLFGERNDEMTEEKLTEYIDETLKELFKGHFRENSDWKLFSMDEKVHHYRIKVDVSRMKPVTVDEKKVLKEKGEREEKRWKEQGAREKASAADSGATVTKSAMPKGVTSKGAVPNAEVKSAPPDIEDRSNETPAQMEQRQRETLAKIDRLLAEATETSMKEAVKEFFFLVKDAQIAILVAKDARRRGSDAQIDTTMISALANEFYGSSGRESFMKRLTFRSPDIDARLREIHLALLPYASGSLIPSRSTSESGTSEPVMPQISFDDLDTPSSR